MQRKHLFEEPGADPDTLRNLGPLRAMAGIWEGSISRDVHPVAEGTMAEPFVERYELQPIDPQTNGPQLFYGLRYHTHITQPGKVETFHDQVGYWLWEPATKTVYLSLAIPRGEVALASGQAAPDAKRFVLKALRGSTTAGIVANPFLDKAFRTTDFEIDVTIGDDGTWSYAQTTTLNIEGQPDPFRHTDRNTLKKIAEPTPNPLANATAR